MKNIFNTILLLSIIGTSSFGANTEVLTKAMVKLINKQKILENAVISLKQSQNKQEYEISSYKGNNKTYNEIKTLNSQISEIQKELIFAKNINEIKIEQNYKYKRNKKIILKIDNFISSNK